MLLTSAIIKISLFGDYSAYWFAVTSFLKRIEDATPQIFSHSKNRLSYGKGLYLSSLIYSDKQPSLLLSHYSMITCHV